MLITMRAISTFCIIGGVTSNINNLFRAVKVRRTPIEKAAGIIFGVTCGCWAASKFDNIVEAVAKCCNDISEDLKKMEGEEELADA